MVKVFAANSSIELHILVVVDTVVLDLVVVAGAAAAVPVLDCFHCGTHLVGLVAVHVVRNRTSSAISVRQRILPGAQARCKTAGVAEQQNDGDLPRYSPAQLHLRDS